MQCQMSFRKSQYVVYTKNTIARKEMLCFLQFDSWMNLFDNAFLDFTANLYF